MSSRSNMGMGIIVIVAVIVGFAIGFLLKPSIEHFHTYGDHVLHNHH